MAIGYWLFDEGEFIVKCASSSDVRNYTNSTVQNYNTTYIFTLGSYLGKDGWYRADFTPCLIEDVPKEYRTMLLLMGVN